MDIVSLDVSHYHPTELLTSDAKWARLKETLLSDHSHTGQIFVPSSTFYPPAMDDHVLNAMATTLFAWVGIKHRSVQVLFSNLDADGTYVQAGRQRQIIVNARYQHNPYQSAAILAHLMTHYLLISRHKLILAGSGENELLSDLASIGLGLGTVVLNGHQYHLGWLGRYRSRALGIGALSPQAYANELKNWAAQHNIAPSQISRQLMPWARHWYTTDSGVRARPEHVRFQDKLVKTANLKTAGLGMSITVLLGLGIYLYHLLPQRLPSELVSQKENIAVLKQAYTACTEAVQQKRQTLDTSNMFVLRTIDGNVSRCTSLRNEYNYQVNDFNQKLQKL